jgi:DNA processing protein
MPIGSPLLSRDDNFYLIALSLVKDIGPLSAKSLLAHFKRAEDIFAAPIEEIAQCPDIGPKRAKAIKDFQGWDLVQRQIKGIAEMGLGVLTYKDPLYPEGLRGLDDSPLVLYYKGTLEEEDKIALAIVGTRDMTDYGSKITLKIASALASAGITIVSGLARGIDTMAHIGALRAKGRTIAVVGSGLDIIYPTGNRDLYRRIPSSGCVLSEFPLGTPPEKYNFPRRNRLISGLSLGVLVVEAAENSGSLITVQYALDQNKEVFAIPGRVDSPLSRGTNNLIKKGARLVQDAEEIIEELLPQLKGFTSSRQEDTKTLEITDKEKAIFNLLKDEPIHIDNILRNVSMRADEVLSILLNLELKGIIRQKEGKRFCKI